MYVEVGICECFVICLVVLYVFLLDWCVDDVGMNGIDVDLIVGFGVFDCGCFCEEMNVFF